MRNLRMMALALATMVFIPGIALATHFDQIVVEADCDGWSAEVHVFWRAETYVGDLDFSIKLYNQTQDLLEQFDWSDQISRNAGGPQAQVYNFSGNWNSSYSGPQFNVEGTFHIVAPYAGGVDEQTLVSTTSFACLVASESSTWSTIKSLYR